MIQAAGILAAAAEVEALCQSAGWKFCFIGGLAVQRWGMPRFTQDVDLTIVTGWGDEARYVDALLRRFRGRIGDVRQFALDHRVVLLSSAAGVDIDVALGALPFEELAVQRASRWTVSDSLALTTCSAEDIIIHKVFAGRDRDWADVETILARQGDKLDLGHIRRELPPLLEAKEDFQSIGRLEKMIATVADRARDARGGASSA